MGGIIRLMDGSVTCVMDVDLDNPENFSLSKLPETLLILNNTNQSFKYRFDFGQYRTVLESKVS